MTVTIPGNASRMCFTSDSVIDDDTPLEPDETFVLEVDQTDPDDPRITVTDGNTTVIILDDDCEFSQMGPLCSRLTFTTHFLCKTKEGSMESSRAISSMCFIVMS
jgi:hypothetical protein